MSTCGICKISVNRTAKDKITCSVCNGYFHAACVDIRDSDIGPLSSKKWSCKKCASNSQLQRDNSASLGAPDGSGNDGLTLCGLKDVLDCIRAEVAALNSRFDGEMAGSLATFHEKLDVNSSLLSQQNDLIARQQELIDALRKENSALKKDLADLSDVLDQQEQYSRRNTIEIQGVPVSENEDVTDVVIRIGKSLNAGVTRDSIDCCHRMRASPSRQSPGIIVRFVRRSDADGFISRRRVRKELRVSHISMRGEDVVYINRSLTPRRRRIFGKARMLLKEGKIKHLWTDAVGRIKVRVVDGGEVLVLRSEADLQPFRDPVN
jgi:hypothetical protein